MPFHKDARGQLISGKRVVVTGGAGFIGSHLVEELAPGNEVIVIDDLCTGRMENIEPFLEMPSVSFLCGSVTDPPLLQKIFQGAAYVFHQAALTQVPQSLADPLAADETNIRGTLNVLGKRYSGKWLLFEVIETDRNGWPRKSTFCCP